ncbi:MarC family protein [Roseiarcus sp.]|uniref:MarC family protein n=1 Tax=Roseiarcus sp. TaxID=1969460 RepID=UPI003F98B6E5
MLGGNVSEIAATANVAFLLAFPSLFSIINPIGGALIFSVYTRAFSRPDRLTTAGLVGLYSLIIMFCALWGGAYVLNFFGVSIDAVRIAGGMVVALSGWHLLNSGDQHPDRKTGDQQPATGDADDDPKQVAFFPLTLPFTTGPGTIAVAITLGAERPKDSAHALAFFLGVTLAAIANAAIIWIAYRFADRLTAAMGATARQVVVRLSAFLLVCIGVQILVTAVGDLVMKWRVG